VKKSEVRAMIKEEIQKLNEAEFPKFKDAPKWARYVAQHADGG